MISGGTFIASLITFAEGGLTLSGGTLGAAVVGAPVTVVSSGASLKGVNAANGLTLLPGVTTSFSDDLAFFGTATLGAGATLRARATQKLGGAGTVFFGDGASLAIDGGTDLTVGAGSLELRGSNFRIERTPGSTGSAALNLGTTRVVSAAGGTGVIDVQFLTYGNLVAEPGSSLSVSCSGIYSPRSISAQNGGVVSINAPAGVSLSFGPYITSGATIDITGPTSLVFNSLQNSGTIRIHGDLNVGVNSSHVGPGTLRVDGELIVDPNVPTNFQPREGGAVVVDYEGASPLDYLRSLIVNGYNGTGNSRITVVADPQHGLGYAEASALFTNFPATFAGELIDDTAFLMRITRYGDADLNGLVNLVDFNRLASNFNGTNKLWSQGDFTYDGIVNLEDFNRLASNFNLAALTNNPTPQDWANLAAAVPEPAAATALAGITSLSCLMRRRRMRYPRTTKNYR